MRRASLLLPAAMIAALLQPMGAQAAVPLKPIQPGAIIFTGGAQCTQSFVYRNSIGELFSSTAGHCVGYVGQRTSDETDEEFGTVVWQLDGTHDYALIRIDPSRYADVSPQLRVWGGPTGYTTSDTTTIGDPVLQHGYGLIYGSNEITRPRRGVLQWDSPTGFGIAGLALFGDSGGPALHGPTGKALGFVNGLGSVTSLVNGSTVEYFLVRAAEAGFDDLEIVTAELAPLI